jgi:uncharacterized membrane protein
VNRETSLETRKPQSASRIFLASALLGIGLGGFLDGIVLHQLLQVHNMLTGVRPADSLVNAEINMFWDGLVHLQCWLFTVAGVFMLTSTVDTRRELRTRDLVGGMFIGWGVLNIADGVINHFIFGLHHFLERHGLTFWDFLFVGSGVLLIFSGQLLRTRKGTDIPNA